MTEPYYQDAAVTLYLGDCLDTLPELAAQSINAIITDPPYNVTDRNGRDDTTIGRVARKDGTYREVNKAFGDWDRDWQPEPFISHTERLLIGGGVPLGVRF